MLSPIHSRGVQAATHGAEEEIVEEMEESDDTDKDGVKSNCSNV